MCVCGRYARFTPADIYARLFHAEAEVALTPSYNVAPSQPVLAARHGAGGRRELITLHWGLIPFWAKDRKMGYRTLNARAETVASKPAFRQPFRRRRCLIAADGFYEWQRTEGGKQPYFIRLRTGEPFAFAGLWDRWEGEGEIIESCTVIVTAANALVATIHDRMPVILSPADHDSWLDPKLQDPRGLQPLLRPYPPDEMVASAVGLAVNNPRHDGPELLAAP
ncbi:MAG: SOS response-associated peptidase [Gammaproteobacteria bacterium]